MKVERRDGGCAGGALHNGSRSEAETAIHFELPPTIAISSGVRHQSGRLGKGGDFHLTLMQPCFVHHLLQLTGCRVVDPFFATLRADGGRHPAHHYDSAPQVGSEGGGAGRFMSAA